MTEQTTRDSQIAASAAIMTALMALALPGNADTFFMSLAGSEGQVESKKRPVALPTNIDQVLRDVDASQLYTTMMNEGNVIEIAGWIQVTEKLFSAGFRKWRQVAIAALSGLNSGYFHAQRCRMLQFSSGATSEGLDSQIRQVKQQLLTEKGVPEGVEADDISWDAASFKTAPTAMELFCMKNPNLLDQFTQEHLAVIDQVQKSCRDAILEKCTEFRARTNTVPDDYLPDMTLFLEQQIGGMQDPDREIRIENIGRSMLIAYVNKMRPVFLTGNLPSALPPVKIYACHDIVTASELRGSIMKLSEHQLFQQKTLVGNTGVISRVYELSNGIDSTGADWTRHQQASMAIKRNTDTYMRRQLRIFGVDYDRPMANLENHLVGSSNNIGQQLEVAKGDAVIHKTEEQKEISKQELSVLLACLRMRCNAVQQSEWELVTDDDLDHLQIVKYLSRQSEETVDSGDTIYRLATTMLEQYSNGHNVVKFQGKMLPQELHELIAYCIENRAKMLIRQIPFFNADINEGGTAFQVMMYSIVQALALDQRIYMEQKQRMARKQVAQSAQVSLM